MPCNLATTQAAACVSGIGKETDPIKLLQAIAQSYATWALSVNPANPVTVAAIQARACVSGIGRLTDELALGRITAQNLCALVTEPDFRITEDSAFRITEESDSRITE